MQILHTALPYFAPPTGNVMRTAWIILRERSLAWEYRMVPRDEWMSAALKNAWADHRARQREHDRRMNNTGHLRYMPRPAIEARLAALVQEQRELGYYSRLPLKHLDAIACEIEVIRDHVLPNITA
jgi:hypothetical protein